MHPGDTVAGRFVLEARVGAGGMGTVYRARDLHQHGTVAIKVLASADAHAAQRFLREAHTLAALRHPGIVRYLAHGVAPDARPFLAMEWLEGETLLERLGRDALDLDASVTLVRRAAEALAVAHAAGVVHRDLKPSNLFLPDGEVARVTLLDFGLALPRDEAEPLTRTGALLGTPGYMAPEQARGAAETTPRADVFSLGCVLFECVAGRPAFHGAHVMAVLAKILLEDAPRLSELCAEVPPALDALVARMLAKDPAARPADAGELVELLAALGPAAPRTPRRLDGEALTGGEQRLLCVALVAHARAAPPPHHDDAELDRATLQRIAGAHGGALERLADGTLVVTLEGGGAATDNAARAARCVLAMRAVLPESPLALATGRSSRSSRWPVGEAIDRAARLLRLARAAPAPSIRVDEDTAALLGAGFDLDADADGPLLRAERGTVEGARTLLGRSTPCVGRELELGTLDAVLAECAAEPVARAVRVTAPAGAGKSRLWHEWIARVRARGRPVEVLVGRGDPLGAGSPFGMLAPALRRAAGILAGEPGSVRRARLRARVARHLPPEDQERVTDFLGELVGAAGEGAPSVQLRAARQDPQLMGDQVLRAFVDWLGAECAAQPVVIVLEDLHWGDLPSVRFLDAALGALADRALLVLALARPEVDALFPRLWAERAALELRLPELTPRAGERLVREVLGAAVAPEAVARIVEQAAGNAFFLEELIRAHAEGSSGAAPGTVLAMVQSRLSELDPEARQVLRAASVFGRVFWHGGVAALLGGDARGGAVSDPGATRPGRRGARLAASLAELSARELVTRRGEGTFPGEVEYRFRHALVREAAYAMLTDEDRQVGHRLAGTWLERAGQRDAAVLAEHFERGGMTGRAVGWYHRAAEQALEGNDFDAVLAHGARSEACGATGAALGALRALEARVHLWRGDNPRAVDRAREAMELLPGDDALRYEALADAALACIDLGWSAPLGEFAALLLEALRGGGSGPLWIAAARVAACLYRAGRNELATRLVDAVGTLEQARALGDPMVEARLLAALSLRAMEDNDLESSLALRAAAVEAFEQAGASRDACNSRVIVAFRWMELGALARAEAMLRDALAAAERLRLRPVRAAALQNLGWTLAQAGALDEALAVERRALEDYTAQGNTRMHGGSRIYLAAILLARGDLVAAEAEARAALALVESVKPMKPDALGVLARVLVARGSAPEALDLAVEAVGLHAALGDVEGGDARIGLAHAEALEALGRRAEARAVIAQSLRRLLERAARIRDPALRESFLVSVPEHARIRSLAAAWA